MAYIDIFAAATDADHVLRKQVMVACLSSAIDIAAESQVTPNHADRLSWARAAFRDPTTAAAKAIWAVLRYSAPIRANPSTASDADVQAAVNAMVNTLAGEV
jgi:hypothetical protein